MRKGIPLRKWGSADRRTPLAPAGVGAAQGSTSVSRGAGGGPTPRRAGPRARVWFSGKNVTWPGSRVSRPRRENWNCIWPLPGRSVRRRRHVPRSRCRSPGGVPPPRMNAASLADCKTQPMGSSTHCADGAGDRNVGPRCRRRDTFCCPPAHSPDEASPRTRAGPVSAPENRWRTEGAEGGGREQREGAGAG